MLNAQWLMLNARDRCVSTDIELHRSDQIKGTPDRSRNVAVNQINC